MRARDKLAVVCALLAAPLGCSDAGPETGGSEYSSFGNAQPSPSTSGGSTATKDSAARSPTGMGTGATSEGSAPAPPAGDPTNPFTSDHPEVVLLLMKGKDGLTWFCTATLVSKSVVVTAAHCLQEDLFLDWNVIAPGLRSRPRVAGQPRMYDRNWEDVASPDLGVVVLDTPIELPRYAELVDVTDQVDSGAALQVGSIVRTAEQPQAPLQETPTPLPLSSTVQFGYTHGYGVPMYSHGGDSGAGMFLIENGKLTHKVVGIERTIEPTRKLDHLSRVDSAYIAWVANAAP